MKKRTYGTGSVRETRPGKWELRYRVPGETRPRSETIDASSHKSAEKELRARLSKIDERRLGARLPLGALFDLYLKDQRKMGRAQAPIVTMKIEKFLRPYFGAVDAYELTPVTVDEYVDHRLNAKPKPAVRTINHELSILQRSVNLARQKRVASIQILIEKLPGESVRQGFLEEPVYRLIRAELPSHQVALFTMAYYTGIRAGELLSLKRQFVDLMAEIPLIKIPGEVTKNGKPRTIPLYHPEMIEGMKFAYQTREPSCPYIFQFRGRRLKNYRQGWEAARSAAGFPDTLFHDTRRTAVRNMERAQVRRADARQISGHLTESVYLRYDIASEQGAFEAAEKLRDFHAKQQARKIVGNLWDAATSSSTAELLESNDKLLN